MYPKCLKARLVVKAQAPPEQVVVVNTIVIVYQECLKARLVVKAQAPPELVRGGKHYCNSVSGVFKGKTSCQSTSPTRL